MAEANKRKKLDPGYGKKPKLGRGLVISSPVRVSEGSLHATGAQLDPVELRFALLFWDRIAWPRTPVINLAGNADSQFLEQANILIRPQPPRQGSGPLERAYANALIGAFLELEAKERGCWSLSEGDRSFTNELSSNLLTANRGVAVELYRSIPIPSADVPLQDILEFRERRQSELLALRHEINEYARIIVDSNDQDAALQAQRERIDQSCANVIRVTAERRLPFTISDIKFTTEIEVGKLAVGAVVGLLAAPTFGLPLVGAAVGGFALAAASGLKVSADFGLNRPIRKTDPFRYVYSLHEEIDWT